MKHLSNLLKFRPAPPPPRPYSGPRKPFALRAYLLQDVMMSMSLDELQNRLAVKGYSIGVAGRTCVLKTMQGEVLCDVSEIGLEQPMRKGVVLH